MTLSALSFKLRRTALWPNCEVECPGLAMQVAGLSRWRHMARLVEVPGALGVHQRPRQRRPVRRGLPAGRVTAHRAQPRQNAHHVRVLPDPCPRQH